MALEKFLAGKERLTSPQCVFKNYTQCNFIFIDTAPKLSELITLTKSIH